MYIMHFFAEGKIKLSSVIPFNSASDEEVTSSVADVLETFLF